MRPGANRRVSPRSCCLRVAGPRELSSTVCPDVDCTNTVHGLAEQTDEEVVATGQATPGLASRLGLGAVAVRAAAGVALSVFEPAPATKMPTIAPTAITQVPTLTSRRMTEQVSARSTSPASLNPGPHCSYNTSRRAAGTPAGRWRA